MTEYEKLKVEFNGVSSSIKKYTSNSNVINYLEKLEAALTIDDIDIVVYCLEQLADWYSKNISNILSNEYVFDKSEHKKNKAFLESCLIKIKESKELENTITPCLATNVAQKKIFLSHCSKDKKYGDALRSFLVGIGLKNSQIIYTSYPANKIPIGENIYDYLRNNINSDVFIIFLLSNDYFESAPCLNEMGAAWVFKSNYECFYTPEFDFKSSKYNQCVIDTKKMGILLKNSAACRSSMIEFKNVVCQYFGLEKIDEISFSSLLEEFMESIK